MGRFDDPAILKVEQALTRVEEIENHSTNQAGVLHSKVQPLLQLEGHWSLQQRESIFFR